MYRKYIFLSLLFSVCLLVAHGVMADEIDNPLIVTAAPAEMQRNLLVVSSIDIAPDAPVTGEVISAEFTLQNVGSDPITLLRLIAGGRGPNCADFTCPDFADYPSVENLTLNPTETYTYQQTRTFWAAGDYFAQVVYQSTSGSYHFIGERIDYTVGEGLELVEPLTLTATDGRVNDLFYARFVVRNVGDRPITLPLIGVFARGPECQEISFNCPAESDFAFEADVTIAPNVEYTYEKWQQILEDGDYAMQIAVSDAAGLWHFLFDPVTFRVLPADIAPRTDEWAFAAHYHPVFNTNDQQRLTQAKLVGAEVVRVAINWRVMEPLQAGQYDEDFYMPRLAELFEYADELDIDIYVMLSSAPCWASADPNKICTMQEYDPSYPPANPSDYANAILELMHRHGDDILAYEVWNEPNVDRFWQDPNPADYVELLQTTYAAIKAQDASATVLGGALAATDVRFLEQLYAEGAQGYFDALSIHPYSSGAPSDCSVYLFSFLCGVEAIRSLMLHNGDDKPIWFTEFGWSSFEGFGGYGEATQLAHLQEALTIIERWEFVPVATWYNLIDTDYDQDAADFEHFMGLFDQQHRPKPAAQWLQNRESPNSLFLPLVQR